MKTISNPLSKKCIALFFILLTLIATTDCNYFKIKQDAGIHMNTMHGIGDISNRYFVHSGGLTYTLTNMSISSSDLSGNLEVTLNPAHYYQGRSERYYPNEKDIINEVHLYLNEITVKPGSVQIPLTSINEIKIIDLDNGRTIATYVISTIGIAAAVFALVMIIVALTKSSCPYIYVNDGDAYVFEGEIYGGAIAANLERDDYMPLPSIKSHLGNYRLRISNELLERQYVDLARLMVVDHPAGTRVLLDKSGKPQLIGAPESAISASSYNGDDLLPIIRNKDKSNFFFNDIEYSKNGILFKFRNPGNSKDAKLILNGKNTLWFDHIIGEFLSKFGSSYDSWMEKQAKLPASKRMQNNLKYDFPLSVCLKTKTGWQPVGYLMTSGPLAQRDFVIPIDLSNVDQSNIEIKIETGFMFWEIDYAAMDFTPNTPLKVAELKPVYAYGTGSKRWTTALAENDGHYMIQEKTGEITELIFNHNNQQSTDVLLNTKLQADDQQQTVFLHTRGYYELVREFKGLPEINELYKFKKPGYFSDYSRNRYLEVLNSDKNLAGIK